MASGSAYIQSSVSRNARTKRNAASLRFFSTLALMTSTRMVWLRSDGTSLPPATTRILPSSISLSPNGGAAHPMSIWPDITAVSVAGMPPVDVGTALMPSSLPKPRTMLWVVEPLVEYEMVFFSDVSLRLLIGDSVRT
jgi:hypothetical protein